MSLLTTEELAQRWGLSARTLKDWRRREVGPPYMRMPTSAGGRATIRYHLSEVAKWEAEHTIKTEHDPAE